MLKIPKILITALPFILIPASVNAVTLGYWRFGDDLGAGFLGDSSGNDNSLRVDYGSTSQASIPASGSGSSFPNPVPQNSLANVEMASKDGVLVGTASSILGDFTSLTAESLFNLKNNSADSTQYIFSHWRADNNNRSFAMGIDESDGRVTGTANQIYLLLSDNGSTTENLPTSFIMTAGIDYYIGFSFDGTTDTNDVVVYQKDLTNDTPMQTVTLSSGFTTLHHSNWSEFTLGGLINNQSSTNSFIDEVRLSDEVLSSSELLIAIPEPSHYAMVFGGLGIMFVWSRRRA